MRVRVPRQVAGVVEEKPVPDGDQEGGEGTPFHTPPSLHTTVLSNKHFIQMTNKEEKP